MSKRFLLVEPKISDEIKKQLEEKGHKVYLPNSYQEPMKEEQMKKLGKEEHIKWKAAMLRK